LPAESRFHGMRFMSCQALPTYGLLALMSRRPDYLSSAQRSSLPFLNLKAHQLLLLSGSPASQALQFLQCGWSTLLTGIPLPGVHLTLASSADIRLPAPSSHLPSLKASPSKNNPGPDISVSPRNQKRLPTGKEAEAEEKESPGLTAGSPTARTTGKTTMSICLNHVLPERHIAQPPRSRPIQARGP